VRELLKFIEESRSKDKMDKNSMTEGSHEYCCASTSILSNISPHFLSIV
jgi:hypothetical protein